MFQKKVVSTRLLFFLLLVSLSSCFERMVDIPEETIGLAPINGEEADKLIQLMNPSLSFLFIIFTTKHLISMLVKRIEGYILLTIAIQVRLKRLLSFKS